MKKWILAIAFLTLQAHAESCPSNLGPIKNGKSKIGYVSKYGNDAVECQQDVIFCLNGQLSGPDLFPSCVDLKKPVCVSGTVMVIKEGRGCLYQEAVCIEGQWEYYSGVDCPDPGRIYDLNPFD